MSTPRNPVGWFELYVQDLKRAQAFYEATFELTLQVLPGAPVEMLVFSGGPDRHGCPGALVKMEGKDSGVGGTVVYFSCADCAVEAGRAAANGGRIVKEKFSIGDYGFIVLLTDTEGNMIGLHSME